MKIYKSQVKVIFLQCLEAEDLADAVIYALSAPAHVQVSVVIWTFKYILLFQEPHN